jgi:NADH-quinone oxidoreductase subunit L
MIGTLAITGVGIPISIGGQEFGLAGFYSKDAIINAAFAAGQTNPVAYFAFAVGLIAAGLTSFYSWRLVFMTFHGHAKWGAHAAHDDHHAVAADDHASHAQIETHSEPDHGDHGHGDHTPHESARVMLIPLLVLAAGALFAGLLFHNQFVGEGRGEFWGAAIANLPTNHVLDFEHILPAWVVWAPLVVTAIGFGAAWLAYIRYEGFGARLAARRGPLWLFLYNKWFFDELYDATFVRAAKWLGDLFWKGGDQKLIDGLGPDGVSAVSYAVGKRTGLLQTGYVYHYAFVMLLGVAALLAYGFWVFL